MTYPQESTSDLAFNVTNDLQFSLDCLEAGTQKTVDPNSRIFRRLSLWKVIFKLNIFQVVLRMPRETLLPASQHNGEVGNHPGGGGELVSS